MDFGNALLLIAAVVGLVELIKRLIPGLDAPVVQVVAIAVAIAMVFAVGATVWAHTQVLGNHALDKLDVASKAFAGLMLGLGSNILDRTLKTVANIGQNTSANTNAPPA